MGTYIGERLLYAPSIGYCILLADLVAWLAGDALPGILQLWRDSPGPLHHCLMSHILQSHI